MILTIPLDKFRFDLNANLREQHAKSLMASPHRQYQKGFHTQDLRVSKNHAVVVVEDLQVKNMSKSARKNVKAKSGLNRTILDASPFELRRQLAYKMRWRGGLLVAIPPGNTSRCCPECRHVAAEKPQDASKIRLCGMRIPNASRLGSSLEHQRGGTRLVSLHASFG